MGKSEFNEPGVPSERRGQMEHFFKPQVQLTPQELVFYSECVQEADRRRFGDSVGRDQTIMLINDVANQKSYSRAMCDRLIAYLDEIYMRGSDTEGAA